MTTNTVSTVVSSLLLYMKTENNSFLYSRLVSLPSNMIYLCQDEFMERPHLVEMRLQSPNIVIFITSNGKEIRHVLSDVFLHRVYVYDVSRTYSRSVFSIIPDRKYGLCKL